MLTKKQQFTKRMFDLLLSVFLLPILSVPLAILIIISILSTGGNGLFVQQRIGKQGKLFRMFKIRTLKGVDHKDIHDIKAQETVFGSWLRKTKLDELPQLINVLMGQMSWVGPRPDVPGYADTLEGEDRMILSIRPGLTGPATLKYRNEDELLLAQPNPMRYNDEVLWPDKVKINKEYIRNWSLRKDINYLWKSVFN